MRETKFNNGDRVREQITGYEGIVVAVTEWLWDCVTYGVSTQKLKDGIPQEPQWFDEARLELVEITTTDPQPTHGGPTRSVPLRR